MEEKTQHEIEFRELIEQYSGAMMRIKEIHINTDKFPSNYFIVDDGLFIPMNGNVLNISGVIVAYKDRKFVTSVQEVEFTWEGVKRLFDTLDNQSWVYI